MNRREAILTTGSMCVSACTRTIAALQKIAA
jgi:hypothetical protein